MGFITGPAKPPNSLFKIGFIVWISILMPLGQFDNTTPSAPAVTVAFTNSKILSDGANLINKGFFVSLLNALIVSKILFGSDPIGSFPLSTLGQEKLNSIISISLLFNSFTIISISSI